MTPPVSRLPALAAFALLGALLFAAGPAAVAGGQNAKSNKKMSRAHADFLDKVSYIISKQERKIFRELPESDRDAFVEEFWKRRDPEPETAFNEYRAEYEDRVAKSGMLFNGEGRPGWRTDRGRIYILFGPPSERLTYPMDSAGYCREVWYYGAFPVVFIDEHCSGYFILQAINLEHLQELNIAQGHFQKTFSPEKRLFDYEVSMQKLQVENGTYEGRVFVDVPYETIWFTFKGGRLETGFDVRLAISDPSGTTVWEAQGSFPLSLEEKDLTEHRSRRFRMEFPVVIDKDLDRLKDKKLRMDVAVKCTTEGEELKKAVAFQLKF
jgi:GWxTD domain-containing protein